MFIEKFEGWLSSLVSQRAQHGSLIIHQNKAFGPEFHRRLRLCVNELWGQIMGYCTA